MGGHDELRRRIRGPELFEASLVAVRRRGISVTETSGTVTAVGDGKRLAASGLFLRWAVAVPVGLLIVLDALKWRWFTHPDFTIARRAARVLFSTQALHLYQKVPQAQMGPLAISIAPLPHTLYNVLVALLAVPFLVLAAGPLTVGTVPALRKVTWGLATLLLVIPWAQLAWKGHADDALVLVGAAVMLTALRRSRTGWAVFGWGVAIAGKPTALVLGPLLLASPGLLVAGLLVTALIWVPFALPDPLALARAGQGVMPVVRGDGPWYLGVPVGRPPAWIRPAQLVLGWTGSALGYVRRRPEVGVLLGLAARAVLEPNPAPAYSISLIALALFVDAGRAVPVATLLAAASFWTSQQVLNGGSGWPRILCLLALVAWSAWRLWDQPSAAPEPQEAGSQGRRRALMARRSSMAR